MQTRTEVHPVALSVVACAVTLRVAAGDEPHLRRRMRLVARIARRMPAGVFEMRLLRPLQPATVHTTGRSTGRRHSVLVLVAPYRGGWVATTCMGRDPDWMSNLRHEPLAEVTVDARSLPVRATFPSGSEHETAVATFAACKNQVVRGIARRLVTGAVASGAQMVVLSPC